MRTLAAAALGAALLAPSARAASAPAARPDVVLVDLAGLDSSSPALAEASARAIRFDAASAASDVPAAAEAGLFSSRECVLSTGAAALSGAFARGGYQASEAADLAAAERVLAAPRTGPAFVVVRSSEPAAVFAAAWTRWRDGGALARSVVVLTSGAGPAGAAPLSERALRVPLLVWRPGAKPARVAARARLIDVAPSLLDWAGLPEEAAFEGVRLEPLIAGRETKPRWAFAASPRDGAFSLFSIAGGGWKLVYDKASGAARLYDLKADPGETKDVSDDHPDVALDLTQRLLRRVRETAAAADGRGNAPSPELLKALRERGYW